MRYTRFAVGLIVGAFTILLTGQLAIAQKPATEPQARDTSQTPRRVKAEPNDAHKKWATQDVPYILTDSERKAWEELTSNEERESFIRTFWDSRDPDPDTEENEFRQEYYERIAYANEHFATGIAGWRTDRGRIYITRGKPDSIESRASGGSYNRPSYESGGTETTYPFEIWFYRHLDGVGDGIEIEFVDPTGTGEYRLARNPDEKLALKNVPGGMRTDSRDQNFQRAQDSELSRYAQNQSLFTPPTIKFGDLDRVLIGSPVFDNNPLVFDLRIDHFRQSDDRVITTFTIQASNKELKFENNGGLETATINILGRITAVSNRRNGLFEDSVTTTATTGELSELREKSSVYQKALALAPGVYKVDVIVRDVGTGNKGIVNMGFTVPKYDEKKLATSTLVLTSTLRPTDMRDIGQRFVIGGIKVIPNLTGVYKQGQELGVYLQVYNAETDQTTLRPVVEIDYVLLKSGKEILRQAEDWSGLSDSGLRLTLARRLPTANMPAGDYEIKVEIRDRVGGQVIESKSRFTIAK